MELLRQAIPDRQSPHQSCLHYSFALVQRLVVRPDFVGLLRLEFHHCFHLSLSFRGHQLVPHSRPAVLDFHRLLLRVRHLADLRNPSQ